MSNLIDRLQVWYRDQCNGEWEHGEGVRIDTLDNPRWAVEIDLRETYLSDVPLPDYSHGIGDESDASGDDWLTCRRDEAKFLGYGGPPQVGGDLGSVPYVGREEQRVIPPPARAGE